MRDKIKAMFLEQKRFGKRFRDYDKFDESEFKDLILMMLDEIHSLLNTINFKKHRKFEKSEISPNQLEELVDILKYWMEIALYLGFTWDEIEKEFWRKSAVCEQRYKQEWIENLKASKYVIVDIDGVLTDYPFGFTKTFSPTKPKMLKMNDLSDELLIPLKTLKHKKHEWRKDGGYSKLGLNVDGKLIVDYLHTLGYKIVLLSNRPVEKYKRIYADTMEWLDNNNIPYDILLFTDDEKGLNEIVNGAKCAIEDDPTQVSIYLKSGIETFVPRKNYNNGIYGVHYYDDFEDFRKKFEKTTIKDKHANN